MSLEESRTVRDIGGENCFGPNNPDLDILKGTPRPDSILRPFLALARRSSQLEWNTAILNQKRTSEIISPAERYYVEPRKIEVAEIYDHFLLTQKNLGCLVDRHISSTYREVKEALAWVARRAGYVPEDFELDIIRSPQENAFILHHEDIKKPHIFITTGLLDSLANRFGRLRQGHLRFVLGHEIAHFKEGHYEQIRRDEIAPNQDPDPIKVRHFYGRYSFQTVRNYFFSLAFTRDQELKADEHAMRWCAEFRRGEANPNPLEGIEVLDFLAEQGRKHAEETPAEKSGLEKRYPLLSWTAHHAISTHPGSEGRAARARGTYRQIEVEMSAKNPSGTVSKQRWKKTEAIESLQTDKEIRPTQVQELLTDLNKLIKDVDPFRAFPFENIAAFVSNRVSHYGLENFDSALDEIRHLTLMLPALFRAHEMVLPFEPYGNLKKEPPDKKELLVQGLSEHGAKNLTLIIDKLRHASEALLLAKLASIENSDERSQELELEVRFKSWLAFEALYPSTQNDHMLYGKIIELGKAMPLKMVELIANHGELFFDFRAVSNEWIRSMVESSEDEVCSRGDWFARVVESEHLELRDRLFRIFLENGAFDEAQDIEELVPLVEQAEALFGREPFWERGGLALLLGEEISFWLTSHFSEKAPRQNREMQSAFEKLLNRKRPDNNGTDPVLLEVSKLFLVKDKGKGSFEKRKEWIRDHFKPGVMRDLVACNLLEIETNLFTELGRSLSNSKEKDVGELTPEKIAVKLIKTTTALLDLFDLSWFTIDLRRGEMGTANRSEAYQDLLYGERSKRQKRKEHTDYVLTDAPYHSALLHSFTSTHYYQLSGPLTAEGNIVRFYLRPFLDCYWGQAHKGEYSTLPKINPQEFYETLSRSNLSRLAADLPAYWSLAFSADPWLWGQKGEERPAFKKYVGSEMAVERAIRSHEPETALTYYARASMLGEAKVPGEEITDFKKFVSLLHTIPAGEFRDYIILREVAASVELSNLVEARSRLKDLEQRLDDSVKRSFDQELKQIGVLEGTLLGLEPFHNPLFVAPEYDDGFRDFLDYSQIKELLSLLRGAGHKTDGPGLKISTTSSEQILRMEIIGKVYQDYLLYLKFKAGAVISGLDLASREVTLFNLHDVATEVARLAFCQRYSNKENLEVFENLTPQQKLDEIIGLYIYPSSERDAHLLKILKEEEGIKADSLYLRETARTIYKLLYSPYHQAHLGQQIYEASIAQDPSIIPDFERHFNLIMETHPAGSVRRERRLKSFFDGGSGKPCVVKSWAERDRVCEVLAEEERTTAKEAKLLRKGGVQFLEAALNELNISAKERVDTILWMVGLREKSHLVSCYEAVEGRGTHALKEEVDKLTDDEKKLFIHTVLVGPHGILRTDDFRAKKEFLDTLFFSVFHGSGEGERPSVRYFKAVYDTMLRHIEPERAAQFLGNFLVAHLEGKDFNQQVKVFFESFGFVGVKTAQWLASNTTMIPEDMKKVLLDLTSRVEGPDCRFVYDLAEKTYGADARKIIKHIGDRVGGGSLMSFYDVELHDGRKGVLGVLRPDIVYALPEDILLVHRLIETMQEAPEIFGGKTVPPDLMDNLVWMSLVETNLGRTAKLQQIMKKQIEDLKHKVPISVPGIWSSMSLTDEDGTKRQVRLNQGSFIFMERAQGVTLDLFIDRCKKEGQSGQAKIKQVKNRVIEVFLDQLTVHGLVHCDLHPGNILVDESAGKITVTILDIGLSTELNKNASDVLKRYFHMAIGSTEFSEDNASLERAVKKLLGLGEVSEEKGRRWIRWTLDVLESELKRYWDDELKERAVSVVWKTIKDKKTSVPNKLSQIMELTREIGLTFPREFYYILRAVSVMDYIWQDVDWKGQTARLRRFASINGKSEPLPELDTELICEKVRLCAEHLQVNVNIERLNKTLNAANQEHNFEKRFSLLRDGVFEILDEIGQDSEELLRTLLQDEDLREELGLTSVAEKARAFFDVQEAEQKRVAQSEFGFLAVQALPKGLPREIAYNHEFGSLASIWRLNFYPGQMLRLIDKRGNCIDRYVVLGHNDLHDPVSKIELGRVMSEDSADELESLSSAILGDLQDQKPSIEDVWADDLFVLDQHLESYKRESRKKETIRKVRHTNLDGTTAAIVDESPYASYKGFLDALCDRELTLDTIYLGDLIERFDQQKIEVLVNGEWRPLSFCMYQKGENSAEYLAHMDQTRRELGLSMPAVD